jgi:hypothetical protein
MKKRRNWIGFFLILVAASCAAILINAGYYFGSSYSGDFCGNCHVIQATVNLWHSSSHRDIDCNNCHGSAFTLDPSVHLTHWNRLYRLAIDDVPERILLKDSHIDAIVERCAGCHQAKYAYWKAGGHSVRYEDIFLDEETNRGGLLNNDCMRCHGMFFEGDIKQIVAPISLEGPWSLVDPALTNRPAIPCIGCHQLHREGQPTSQPDYSDPASIAHSRVLAVYSLAFYDRRERMYFPAVLLPLPKMKEVDRAVEISPDSRQGLCYQCHAPEATMEVGTGDDRTPVGVHEGIGCLGCHSPHALDASASCANCHPRMSNCGLEVETMDTSYRSPESPHNIHFVKCQDCHPEGVPAPQG